MTKSKIKLKEKGFTNTYSALIQIGFLWETENTSALNKRIHVHFANLNILACCIAAFILRNDANFGVMKLEYIEQHWSKDQKLKTSILKWCLFQSHGRGKMKEWITGYREHLNANELKGLEEFIWLM